MKFRSKFLPHRLVDIFAFSMIAILIPLGVLFEICVVLPFVHEPGCFKYNFTLILALFMLFNFMFNLAACMLVDTSVDFKRIAKTRAKKRTHWRHCTICDCSVPPMSWHCKSCGTCILKRDHHCFFTGCCIGHNNERYFMCLLMYTIMGSVLALIYNIVYMYHKHIMVVWSHLIVIYPLNLTFEFKVNALLMFLSLDLVLLFLATAIFKDHLENVLRGGVKAEQEKDHIYTKREIHSRFKSVLGKRMHLTWICPLIESKLPNDGYSLKNLN